MGSRTSQKALKQEKALFLIAAKSYQPSVKNLGIGKSTYTNTSLQDCYGNASRCTQKGYSGR
jgi:hypothetical protein